MFFKIIFWQLVAAVIVIAVLKALLQKNLVEAAVREFDILSRRVEREEAREVVVTSHKPLSPVITEKIRRVARKNLGDGVAVRFAVDKQLQGGATIRVAGCLINLSLRERLRQALGK